MGMMSFEPEELMPVVAELAQKYTSKESTSVSYETARQLMEAVLYCINQCSDEDVPVTQKGLSAREAYELGYQKLVLKVKETQALYNNMITDFCAYGNENYYDTVTKALPGFFLYYNLKFAPHETIITMDYPTIIPIVEEKGILAIQKYVEYISMEQIFMNRFDDAYVFDVFNQFQKNYRKQFYNICSILLRHVLGKMLINNYLTSFSGSNYDIMKDIALNQDALCLEHQLLVCLENLIKEQYDDHNRLKEYLSGDIKNFVVELRNAATYDRMEKIVVL